MALTYLIFRRTRTNEKWGWHYRYLRSVRWSDGIIHLQTAVWRIDRHAVAMSPEEANRKFPNVGDWPGSADPGGVYVPNMETADDMGSAETFRHDVPPRCELCGRRMEPEETGPGRNDWDWICPRQEAHG